MKRYLTTGRIAQALEVAPATVSRWCDGGLLPCWHVPAAGHRLPGKGDRRIRVADVIAFAVAHGLPLEGLCGYQTAVLLLSPDAPLLAKLKPLLPSEWETTSAGSLVGAGVALARRRYNAVLIDGDLGAGVREVLAHLPALQPGVPVVLMPSENGGPELTDTEVERVGVWPQKPVNPQDAAKWLRHLAATRAGSGRAAKAREG